MAVAVLPISEDDVPAVGTFLSEHWPRNDGASAEHWMRTVSPPWQKGASNYGYMLVDDGAVVGVYLAMYADRTIDGRVERFCNLATWYVRPEYRLHSLRLLKVLLAQDGLHFTDLTPRADVEKINRRFKFQDLDTTFALVPGLPYPTWPGRVAVTSSPAAIEGALTGRNLEEYRDHADATGVRHFLISKGDAACHVILRRHRIKGIRYFASVLHVSDRAVFRAGVRHLARHLLLHYGVIGLLVELRLVDFRPRPTLVMRMNSNRRMFRSHSLDSNKIDYLYSEVTWSGE